MSWFKATGGALRAAVLAAVMAGSPVISLAQSSGVPVGEKIKIGTINILTFSSIYVAKELGYFADEGLDAELFETTSGTNLNAALLGGSIVATASGYTQPLIMAEKGKALQSLVGLEMASPYVFIARPNLAIPVDDPKGMASMLKGKRFCVVSIGSTGHKTAEGLLAEHGLKSDDVIWVSVGTGSGALAALQTGAIDIMDPTEPDVTRILEAGAALVVLDLRTTKAAPNFSNIPTTTVQATTDWIKANPKTAAAIVRAIARADKTLREDSEASLKVLAKLYPAVAPDKLKAMYDVTKGNFRAEITREKFDLAQKAYLDWGIITKPARYGDVTSVQFEPLWFVR